MYIITDYARVSEEEGYAPVLPDASGFSQLCAGSRVSPFALFEVFRITEEQITLPMERVTGELAQLLQSAERYPPALAKARSTVERREESMTRDEFQMLLASELRARLDDQRNCPYFLARCVDGDSGYKGVGSYYWIAGWKQQRSGLAVTWVSDDYFFYADPVTDFDVIEALLREWFGEPRQLRKVFRKQTANNSPIFTPNGETQ